MTGGAWVPVPPIMVPGTMSNISSGTTLENFEARSAEKKVFRWYQNFQSGTTFYLILSTFPKIFCKRKVSH